MGHRHRPHGLAAAGAGRACLHPAAAGRQRCGLAQRLQILYGGSVKPQNAAELFGMADIDGGLIGGASLVAQDFLAICRRRAKLKDSDWQWTVCFFP
jgi:triosephosphate isomerase